MRWGRRFCVRAGPARWLERQSQAGAKDSAGRGAAAAPTAPAQAIKAAGSKWELLRAECPHHVWAIDFQFDQTTDGRTLKYLNVTDEYIRLALAIRVGRCCRAAEVIDTIEDLLKVYLPPIHLRMDNGPEFIANALQEWCTDSGCNTAYSRQVHPGRIHSWSRLTAGSGMKP